MLSEQKTPSKNQIIQKEVKNSGQRTRWRKERNSGPPIFISKTYQILQNQHYKEVASWNEEGTHFIIKDVDKFQQQVLPIYFRHRNFSSFVRQLNMYDFHKIRNELNRSIFEHKEFQRDHKECLRKIKRKGCNNSSISSIEKNKHPMPHRDEAINLSDDEDNIDDAEETPRHEDKYQKTIESIQKLCQESPMSSIRVIHAPLSPSPKKREKMEEFMNSLPEIIETEEEIQNTIKQLKKNPDYECLNTKNDIRKIISRIRRKIPKRDENELDELSIEEEIIADKIDRECEGHHLPNPSLAVLSTQKFLLPKSLNLIGSMNFCEDAEHLLYQRLC